MLSLPPIHNTPLLSTKGSSLNRFFDWFTPLELRVPELSDLTSPKNDFLFYDLEYDCAPIYNISTSYSLDCQSDGYFLIFFINICFVAKITLAITLFIFNQFRVTDSNLEMTSSLILTRLTVTPFFSSGSLSFICLTALSPPNQVSLHDQRNSGLLNHLFICQDPLSLLL